MSSRWVTKHHSELSLNELYEILRLRNAVYIVELDCPVGDIDGEDLVGETYHLMRFDETGKNLVAYLRMHKMDNNDIKVRRVVVAKDSRGNGMARELMGESIKWSKAEGASNLVLAARIHLQKFYESLGFVSVSDSYFLEAVKVWHVDMKLELV